MSDNIDTKSHYPEYTELIPAPSTLSIRLQSAADPSGFRTLTVAFPTREHWLRRQAKRPLLIRSMGRKQETSVKESPDEDLRILLELTCEADDMGTSAVPALESYEASHILSRLSLANFSDLSPVDEHFQVHIETVAGMFSPILRIPTLKEVQTYQSSRSRTLSAGRLTEVYINLQAGERLFDACTIHPSPQGTAITAPASYPIIWKAAAASALVDAMDEILSPDPSEDLFRP